MYVLTTSIRVSVFQPRHELLTYTNAFYIPSQVMGLSGVPAAGEVFEIRPDLDDARSKAEERGYTQRTQRLANLAGEGKITLQSLAAAAAVAEEGLEFGRLNLILKVDVAGSAEAIRSALEVGFGVQG